mgnify:CR=1 FL=1
MLLLRDFPLSCPLVFGLLLAGLTFSPVSDAQSLSDNPLPPCPDTPNCERTARAYDVSADALYRAAQHALQSLDPVTLRLPNGPRERRAEAVYRVALIFKDDVEVAVQTREDGGSVLYVRSASRVGYSDLGVNRRRVRSLLAAVEEVLGENRPPSP